MSGTNKLVLSSVTKKNGSNSILVPCLENANEEAAKMQGNKTEKKTSKKK